MFQNILSVVRGPEDGDSMFLQNVSKHLPGYRMFCNTECTV